MGQGCTAVTLGVCLRRRAALQLNQHTGGGRECSAVLYTTRSNNVMSEPAETP